VGIWERADYKQGRVQGYEWKSGVSEEEAMDHSVMTEAKHMMAEISSDAATERCRERWKLATLNDLDPPLGPVEPPLRVEEID